MRNALLEAAIAANPDDEAAYLVYADWLQQQGDPLGELIVHARGNDAFVAEHETDLLGPAADLREALSELAWLCGFLSRAKLAQPRDDERPFTEILATFLDADVARFVADLTLGIVDYEQNDYESALAVIGQRELLALRRLFVGDFTRSETELNWSHLGTMRCYRAIPNLRALIVRCGAMSFGEIVLPELREFVTITGGLRTDAIESIASAEWPKLEKLSLQIGADRWGSNIDVPDLKPIVADPFPPTLRHLGIRNFRYTDDFLEGLIASKLLKRITELDLSMGTLSAEGAKEMIANKRAFAHLTVLDLSQSMLDEPSVAKLRKAFPQASLADQRFEAQYPDELYIAAGE